MGSLLLFAIGGFALLLALYCFGSAWLEYRRQHAISSHGIPSKGKITDRQLLVRGSAQAQKQHTACIPHYSYEVDGTVYTGKQEIKDAMVSTIRYSTTVDLRYLPTRPQQSRLTIGKNTVRRNIGGGVFGLILCLLALIIVHYLPAK